MKTKAPSNMWLFHLHSTVKHTAFFSTFPIGGIRG